MLVIEFYNRGGMDLRPLNLTAEEKSSLRASLQSLSGIVQEGIPKR